MSAVDRVMEQIDRILEIQRKQMDLIDGLTDRMDKNEEKVAKMKRPSSS